MRIVIALVIWIGAVAGAVEVSSVVASSIHHDHSGTVSATGSNGSTGSSDGGGGGSQDPSSIRATDAASLFRSSNFERALGAARSQLGTHAQLDNFVVYPGYLAVSAVKSGHLVEFYVDANGRSSTTSTSASAGDTSLFSLARVKAEAPAGLTKRIAKLGHTPESQLHYMVARTDPINGKFEWLVYPLEGNRVEYYQAVGGTGPLLEYLRNSSTGLQPVR